MLVISCFFEKEPLEEWKKKGSILSNKPLFPKEIMLLDKRKKFKALTPFPCLLTQCYKLTPLYKKENKRNMQLSLNIHHDDYSKLFSKMTYFTSYPFPKNELLKIIKLTMLNLLTSLHTLCFKRYIVFFPLMKAPFIVSNKLHLLHFAISRWILLLSSLNGGWCRIFLWPYGLNP